MSSYDDPEYIFRRRSQAEASWRMVLRKRVAAAVQTRDHNALADALHDGALLPGDMASCIVAAIPATQQETEG